MKSQIFLMVVFCLVISTIARRHEPRPSEFSCPKDCDCDKLNYYKESKCTRNGSTLDLILRRTSVFHHQIASPSIRGDHLTVNCTTGDHFPYEILPEFNFTNLVFIRYNGCPLPLSKSFSKIHSGLYEFHFSTTESVSLSKEYFNGLDNIVELYLGSSSSIDLADDVFTGLPFLEELTIISNEINAKIFDYPSNVTDLGIGGVSDEFHFEDLKKWSKLTMFSMTNMKIQHLTKKMFANLPNIKILTLKFNEITSFDADVFEPLEKLQSISLVINKIVNLPSRLIIKSDSFNYFRMECDKDTSFDTLPDEFLSNMPKLRTVYIVRCMKSVPENLLKNSTNIYELNIRDNSLTDLPENFLANQTKLGYIYLSMNRFSKSSDKFFENLLTKPTWDTNGRFHISFISNDFESLSRQQISYLSQFYGYFDFRSNSITDLSGFDGLIKGHEGSSRGSFINLERNPINCDCSSVNAYKKYAVTLDNFQTQISRTICATPLNLNGTAVINVNC